MWFLLPTGLPYEADDGSLTAQALLDRGYPILQDADVPAAIAAFQAGTAGPPGADLGDVVLDSELDAALAGYPTTTQMNTAIGDATVGLASTAQVDTAVADGTAGLASTTEMNDAIAASRVASEAEAAATYATQTALDALKPTNGARAIGQGELSQITAAGGDETTRLNDWLAATSPLGVKQLIGDFTISGPLTVPAGTYVDASAATIAQSSAVASTLMVGDRCTVVGGTITSPAVFDGSNTEWTYAVVHITGRDCTVRGVRLVNVPRVGIGAKNTDGTTRVLDCIIEGNYPAGAWTEVETGHLGIALDPGADASRLIARGNTITSCVQGVFLGNYGTGTSIGTIVAGNVFEGCHNHAVYGSAGIRYAKVTGNTIVDCSRPIAMTGEGHDVSHNTAYATGTGGNLHTACSIDMRDAVGCTIACNTLVGDLYDTAPAIDLHRTGTNVVVKGNRVIGNKITVTGVNSGLGIRVGTGAETDCRDNIIAENDIRAPGVANQGVISWFGANGSQGHGNKCLNNSVTIIGPAHGIFVSEQRGLDVRGNRVRLEYDSATAITIGGVVFTGNTARTRVCDNQFEVTAAWGTNVSFRAQWEVSGTLSNLIGPNTYALDGTKLAGAVTHFMQSTSGSLLDEQMPGAPAVACGPGSRWIRTDGGAGTTLYIKESAASSAIWRAV